MRSTVADARTRYEMLRNSLTLPYAELFRAEIEQAADRAVELARGIHEDTAAHAFGLIEELDDELLDVHTEAGQLCKQGAAGLLPGVEFRRGLRKLQARSTHVSRRLSSFESMVTTRASIEHDSEAHGDQILARNPSLQTDFSF
jgi:hypothetical protein